MGSSIILAGHYEAMNFVAGSSTVFDNVPLSSSTPIAAGFDLRSIADREPGTVTRLTLPDNDIHTLGIDLNKIRNGGMEVWTRSNVPDEWTNRSTAVGATVTRDTTAHTGSFSAKLQNSGGTARIRQSRLIRPGDSFTVSVALRGDGTNTISAFCINPNTGRFMNSSGTWVDSITAFATRSTASFAVTTVNSTVEDFSKCQKGTVKLIFEVEQGGASGAGFVDEFRCWPHWNFAAIIGHNAPRTVPVVNIEVDDNAAFSSPSGGVTLTAERPSMWGVRNTLITDRYARIAIDGSGSAAVGFAQEFGEWIVSRVPTTQSPITGIRIPMKIKRTAGASGDRPASVDETEISDVDVALPWITKATWDSLRLEIGSAARYGGHPSVLIPVGPDDIPTTGMAGSEREIFFGNLALNESRIDHDGKYELRGTMTELEYANHVK